MVFKGRFFSSRKQESWSPDRSSSPGSNGSNSNSPNKTEKKKPKSNWSNGQQQQNHFSGLSGVGAGSSSSSKVTGSVNECSEKGSDSKSNARKDYCEYDRGGSKVVGGKKKDDVGKDPQIVPKSKDRVSMAAASASPILPASLGLNKIKTRSGPLPQESFLVYRAEKGVGVGSSNLSRPSGTGGDGVGDGGVGRGGGKKGFDWMEVVQGGAVENAAGPCDSMSTRSGLSTEHSPNVQNETRIPRSCLSSGSGIWMHQLAIGLVSYTMLDLVLHWGKDILRPYELVLSDPNHRYYRLQVMLVLLKVETFFVAAVTAFSVKLIFKLLEFLNFKNASKISFARTNKYIVEATWGLKMFRGLHTRCPVAPQAPYECETPKESESPRFQDILRFTSGPRKKNPADWKSFSHELNSKGVRPFPFWKPRGINNLEASVLLEVLVMIQAKFEKAKEEVDSDLAVFAADLVGILEKNAQTHPEWQETIEDLLVLARTCALTTPNEFWLRCEGIVQDLDDSRQELPPGMLKQLHTRMLFILTRCTRLLQFHKESGFVEDEHVLQLRESRILQYPDKKVPPTSVREGKSFSAAKAEKPKKFYSQEQHGLGLHHRTIYPTPAVGLTNIVDSSASRERISSWKKLPSNPAESKSEVSLERDHYDHKLDNSKIVGNREAITVVDPDKAKVSEVPLSKESLGHAAAPSKHQHKASWGYWGDQPSISESSSIICRICEEEVATLHVEDHSRVCAIADRCDQKGLSVNERLLRIADTLEKLMDPLSHKDLQPALGSSDPVKLSTSNVTEESVVPSPRLSELSRRGSEDMLDCFPEADGAVFIDDLKILSLMSCKTRFGPKSDQGMATSSAGSMTPRSPLMTPTTSQIDLLLSGKGAFSEHEDYPLSFGGVDVVVLMTFWTVQMVELADIARLSANTPLDNDNSLNNLLNCLEDLRVVIERRKFDDLIVQTFGARIEKLIREKYLQLCELVDNEKVDLSTSVIDEDAPLEDDLVHSLKSSPVHPSKDRTSIEDFEIIKPISRGAFGRVLLAKKRTTGDLFAIKFLKKADMIRKNAVESILAERDILISVRNPFVVRFFYSFTCRENLYLVMEYLNGGDLYSLLRNLGCLDEDVARVYIAEVVLALEYLHSLNVVHRDLKPDNLLIAHDGHIKLTDFGLSKVGLINSTDDLSGPAVSVSSFYEEGGQRFSASEHQQERRKKRSAVGTPDYLAPEILLGMGHGATADWWSVGVILFELIVGIPPFNAEHPQQSNDSCLLQKHKTLPSFCNLHVIPMIFDNILNKDIPWPRVPEEMSWEAYDIIDKLLTEDPNQRLGAKGASQVKQHPFFRDINWDTLARQKAAFVPASESALDTSYFTSRYSWNHSDNHVNSASEFENSSDDGSGSGSSSRRSNHQVEVNDAQGDERDGMAEFVSGSSVDYYSFSNFSFKNLSQLASINYDLLVKGSKDYPAPDHDA
ncbi:putative serine/threonine protein kinase IREH1 [Drosera capensis]